MRVGEVDDDLAAVYRKPTLEVEYGVHASATIASSARVSSSGVVARYG